MKVEFISNASVLIELVSGKSILVDPWLYPTYHGSWHNFPPLSECGRNRYLSFRPDYIHISHLHPDHLDPKTLEHYDKETPMLIGKLPHPHLEGRLKFLGFKNIIQLALNQPTKFLDGEIIIWEDFHAMHSEPEDLVAYNMDTSLWLKDVDGVSIFHINDNVITDVVAHQIVKTHGSPTIAIVPYSGASMYPHAFTNYTDLEKTQKREELEEKTLSSLFSEVSNILNSKYVIPAAGSYVMGGRLSEYNTYLHQATPDRVKTYWAEHSRVNSELYFMQEGDVLDTDQGTVVLNNNAPLRNFTRIDRDNYGKTLTDFQLDHELISIPDSFEIPWARILTKCRRNLWWRQQQLNILTEADISINLMDGDKQMYTFKFALESDPNTKLSEQVSDNTDGDRYQIAFGIDWRLMMMVVLGGTIWNNLEIGALVSVSRKPDRYHPTIHSLMSYFVL